MDQLTDTETPQLEVLDQPTAKHRKRFSRFRELKSVRDVQGVMLTIINDDTQKGAVRAQAARVYADLSKQAMALAGIPLPGSMRPEAPKGKKSAIG